MVGLPRDPAAPAVCPTCERPLPRPSSPWPVDPPRPPSGRELAEYLAADLDLKLDDRPDLIRVAEYVAIMAAQRHLYRLLRNAFNTDFAPTALHQLIAEAPRILREKGWVTPQLIVTTNYDDMLERAFRTAGQEFDLFVYMAVGPDRGRFVHVSPDGEPTVVMRANEYTLDVDDDDNLLRPAILKIHGTVQREKRRDSQIVSDSFVITEDDYVDYLTRNISELLPTILKTKLQESTILFLGYSLRDWNVRAMLRRLWEEARIPGKGWAILQNPELLDERAWEERNVKILRMTLEDYVAALRQGLEQLPAAQARASAAS
jgi:hypothetical protein